MIETAHKTKKYQDKHYPEEPPDLLNKGSLEEQLKPNEAKMNIYVTTQGAYIKKSGDTFIIEKNGEKLCQHPLKAVSLIVLFGSIQLTNQVMLALLEKGCDIAMMTQSGHFRGRMCSAYSKNIHFRLEQYKKYFDTDFRLEVSKQFVYAKITNGIYLLKQYSYNANNPFIMQTSREFNEVIKKVLQAETLESLRGYEGKAAKLYFSEFAKCFIHPNIKFKGRVFFPSPDPINALLSFGYSFVAREMQALLEAFGFDPYLGLFHEVKYGRASLSLDILEEFRHCLVDKLVLKLINKRILKETDFYTDKKTAGCYLKRESLNVFIRFYEQMANSENITYRKKTSHRSFRKIFVNQVETLKKSINNDLPYHPFLISEKE